MQLARWYFYWWDNSGKCVIVLPPFLLGHVVLHTKKRKILSEWHANSVLCETLMKRLEFVYWSLPYFSKWEQPVFAVCGMLLSSSKTENSWMKKKGPEIIILKIKMYLSEPLTEAYVESNVSLAKYKLVLLYHRHVLQYFSFLEKVPHCGSIAVRSCVLHAHKGWIGKTSET